MIENYLSTGWHAIAPGVLDHLWQSTLVALVAALLTLALRNHHARARYWLWLAASLKFLVPFSLLVGIGSHFARRPFATTASTNLYFAIVEISQPFSQATTRIPPQPGSVLSSFPWIPVLAAVWLCGFLTVLFLWIERWRLISSAMKSSVPLHQGREVNALRRLEQVGGLRKPIAFLLSRTSLEPGIFGITRPTLIWPEGISTHLDDAHLEAVLAHEVWHVRRHDNLSATLHMLVEAIFWFHPLVWWLGTRLMQERERACDEEVVALGNSRRVYAESILKVCEFCLSSPLVCVSGVTGADLKRRMVHIMSDRILHQFNFASKLLLTAAASLAIALPITFGMFHATPGQAQAQSAGIVPKFASISVKPNTEPGGKFFAKVMFSLDDGSFTARGITLQRLIQMAYNVQESQISGPAELKAKKFDIDAKLDPAAVEAFLQLQSQQDKLGRSRQDSQVYEDQLALKALLSDRFKLVLHPETANLLAYDLVVADGGSKMQESKTGHFIQVERGELDSQGVPMGVLTEQLSQSLGQTVVDRTGLSGNYAFTLRWTPDAAENAHFRDAEIAAGAPAPSSPDPNRPSLVTAVEQQLGLKLEAHNAPVPVLVIDHFEFPTEN
jgi:bla regulator protein BlaR1